MKKFGVSLLRRFAAHMRRFTPLVSRFTLRDLFWLTLVAAMGCAWWIDRRKWGGVPLPAREWRGRAEALERAMGYGGWKVKWNGGSLQGIHQNGGTLFEANERYDWFSNFPKEDKEE